MKAWLELQRHGLMEQWPAVEKLIPPEYQEDVTRLMGTSYLKGYIDAEINASMAIRQRLVEALYGSNGHV